MNETDNDIKIQIKNENICVIHVNLKLDKIANYLVMRDNHAHPSRKCAKTRNKKHEDVEFAEREKQTKATQESSNASIRLKSTHAHFHCAI